MYVLHVSIILLQILKFKMNINISEGILYIDHILSGAERYQLCESCEKFCEHTRLALYAVSNLLFKLYN